MSSATRSVLGASATGVAPHVELTAMIEPMTKRNLGPSRKASLAPPPPEVRRLPRTSDFNFASYTVARPLIEAGWNVDRAPEEGAERFALALSDPRQRLDRDMKGIVARYVADVAQRRARPAITTSKLRARASKFRNDVAKLLGNFRDHVAVRGDREEADVLAVDGALFDAVDIRLESQGRTGVKDLGQIRDILRAVLEAIDAVQADESTKPDRAAHELLKSLANVYSDLTGSAPSTVPNGPFFRFVEAVNRQIPDSYRAPDLVELIPGAIAATSRGPHAPCCVVTDDREL
jgi:hypothetical protein